jgi:Golgi apparatus protein 1
MLKTRQRIVEDYRINPDLVARCSDEIHDHCDGLQPGGDTLHCLMALARTRKGKDRSAIRPECSAEVRERERERDRERQRETERDRELCCCLYNSIFYVRK